MGLKVLLIGNSARAHVVAESFKDVELYSYMESENPGISKLSKKIKIGSYSDLESIKEFAKDVDFAFIGPEKPLAEGVVDALEEIGIKCIGPKKSLARIESSKSFARDLMEKYHVPGNPLFKVFYSEEGMEEFVNVIGDFVVKADGLQGGKGVKVMGDHFNTVEEGLYYAKQCLKKDGQVVIEEKLIGEEFSLMFFCDGKTIKRMPAVQDHKRAYENDEGPNTGGMGSYSCADHSLPFLSQKDIYEATEITWQVVNALGNYKGIIYGGFIATKNGVKVIEFNARFGDPEAMNVLPILKTNFTDICLAIINGRLSDLNIVFDSKATVCKYVVPEGYPTNPCKGKIEVLGEPYFASVDSDLNLSGSRAVAFVGIADDISEAEEIAERNCLNVKGPVFHRKDIGTSELIEKRIKHMKELRK